MVKSDYIPDAIELQGAPDLFLYELRMFRVAMDALTTPSVQGNTTLSNVVLEAALIHARNLYDFFLSKKSPKDNIIAGHFVSNADGTPWKSSKLTFIASCKGDINKALSHLTYTRVKFKPTWNLNLIRGNIEDAYTEFLDLFPIAERHKWET
ncbi:MAG: hypothetical protein P9M03_08725 [Candidatus Theseobacter exili]|nr:hypothetical protein [Candidatus Theseobacter exili]